MQNKTGNDPFQDSLINPRYFDADVTWPNATLIAFDTETSGKYPLSSEICEIAAVKWRAGVVVEEFQSLVRVNTPMNDAVIAIHHITNEMLIGAPSISEVVAKFHAFISDGFVIAHHAPFDLGFLAYEFEKLRLPLPKRAVLCTSLISRQVYAESPNHRLATLMEYLKLPFGQAHRALDDSRACLAVALKCFEKLGADYTIGKILDFQSLALNWTSYSIADLRSHPVFAVLVESLEKRRDVQIIYAGGSRPGEARTVHPVGLVRNPQGDFFVACDEGEEQTKRFFLDKITAARM